MKHKLRALIPANKTRGQSLVELAISLTVMLLLLSGAVTFGMALFSYVAIRDAAQEGALYGSFNPYIDSNLDGKYEAGEPLNVNANGNNNGTKDICTRVQNASTSPVNMTGFNCSSDGNAGHGQNNIDVWLVPSSAPPCEGTTSSTPNAIQVRVEYNFQVFMPLLNALFPDGKIHLNAVVTDTILEPACP